MKTITLKNIVWKEGKFFVAQCLNVDVSSFGNTKKQALSNLKEAIELSFEGKKTPKISSVKSPVINDYRASICLNFCLPRRLFVF